MTARFVALVLGFIAGIVAAVALRVPVPPAALLSAAAIGLATMLWTLRQARRWLPVPLSLIVASAVVFSWPLGYWRTMQKIGPPKKGSLAMLLQTLPARGKIRLKGRIAAEPEFRTADRGDLRLRVTAAAAAPAFEWVSVTPDTVQLRIRLSRGAAEADAAAFNELMTPAAYGFSVEVATQMQPPRPRRNPGEFDVRMFLLQNGLRAQFAVDVGAVQIVERSRGNVLTELALQVKSSFLETYKTTIAEPASRLAAGTTLGSRRALQGISYRDVLITDAFRHAGVGHVLAVSGLHVSIIMLLLYSLFRLCGLKPRIFVPILIFLLILFALLTGARPSSVRAVIMNSVGLVAFAYLHCNLRQATYVGLATSAFLILLGNPLTLYSPSFLLSFGAVLALILITPPLDDFICRLRGGALLGFCLWGIGAFMLCCWRLDLTIRPSTALGLGGALWLLIKVGSDLNRRLPWLWQLHLGRLPMWVRLLMFAQLAIQAGMMVPLSAWFFGQFPIAGVLVNLAAIPAVGVMVQLSMLTGLAGLVPGLGWLAAAFGAMTTVVGDFFFWLTHVAVQYFPYPACPKPSLVWMIGYYAAIAALLLLDLQTVRLQELWYRLWHRPAQGRCVDRAMYLPALALTALLAVGLRPGEGRLKRLVVFAAGSYPVLGAISDTGAAALLNTGDRFTAGNVVFNGMRHYGASRLSTVIVASPTPEAGLQGIAALSAKIAVDTCYLPVVADEPAHYLVALGDEYIREKAVAEAPWAVAYDDAYRAAIESFAEHQVTVREIGNEPLLSWPGLTITPRPRDWYADRFVATTLSAVCELDVAGWRWLVITDTLPEILPHLHRRAPLNCDVLVLPCIAFRGYYNHLLSEALQLAQPRLLLIADGRPSRDFDPDALTASHPELAVMTTCNEGAIEVRARGDGLHFHGYASGREIILPRR